MAVNREAAGFVNSAVTRPINGQYGHDYWFCPTTSPLSLNNMTMSKVVSRKPQYKDDCSGRIEILQRVYIFKANCCLKAHNAHLKLASPISG